MKKFFVISLIVFLILFTAFIKNSTKRIDDEIFTTRENIRILKKDFEKIKLEHNFLSSADKLVEFQIIHFEKELVKTDIKNIKIIHKGKKKLVIENFKFIYEK